MQCAAVRGAVIAAVVLITVTITGGPVRAVTQVGRDEVYAALGVDRVPADYVVMVDVSGSMSGDRYDQVKRSLTAFFAALAPDDQVTLVPFAEAAAADTYPAGRSPGSLVDKLPPAARGQHTDIGAAIEKSIEVLGRPGAPPLATVVLLTDGLHDPPPGSPYPFTAGYQWNELGRSARGLTGRSIAAYAVPLAGTTGAPLLRKVFPNARVLEPAAVDRLTAALEQPKDAARAAKARSVLAGDAGKGVQVRWPDGEIGAGRTELTVRLESTMAHVPLVLTRPVVSATHPDVRVSVPDVELRILPGGAVTLPVTVDWDAGPRRAAPLSTVTGRAGLTLSATLASPWSDVLTRDLQTTFEPALAGADTETQLSAQRGSLAYWTGTAALLLVLAALLWWWRNRRLSPALTGTLVVRHASGSEHRVPLAGRRVQLSAGSSGLPGVGVVVAARSSLRSARPDLVIDYSPDGSADRRDTGSLAQGTTVTVGGAEFRWDTTPGRTTKSSRRSR